MYGKRFTSLAAALFLAFLFLSGQVEAQVYVPPVSAAACAECGGVGSHKTSCPHYRSSQEDSDSQSSSNKPVTTSSNRGDEPYSDTNFFGLIDGKPLTNKEYWTILMDICPYCGARNNKSHKSDCTIGNAFKMWHEYSNSGRDKDAIRMRDNIVALKLSSSRGKATLASMRNPSASKPSSSGASSTSLKNYTPVPEKPKPTAGKPIMDRPVMTRVAEHSGINEHKIVYDDTGKRIANGEQLEYFDDAIIARSKGKATLYNWKGQSIYFDKGGWKSNYVDDISCYNSDKGPYYLIKVKDGQYTIIARGFRQVGGTYSSENEAHEAMKRL